MRWDERRETYLSKFSEPQVRNHDQGNQRRVAKGHPIVGGIALLHEPNNDEIPLSLTLEEKRHTWHHLCRRYNQCQCSWWSVIHSRPHICLLVDWGNRARWGMGARPIPIKRSRKTSPPIKIHLTWRELSSLLVLVLIWRQHRNGGGYIFCLLFLSRGLAARQSKNSWLHTSAGSFQSMRVSQHECDLRQRWVDLVPHQVSIRLEISSVALAILQRSCQFFLVRMKRVDMCPQTAVRSALALKVRALSGFRFSWEISHSLLLAFDEAVEGIGFDHKAAATVIGFFQ